MMPPSTRLTYGLVALLFVLALLFGAVAAVVTMESNRHTRWVPGSGLATDVATVQGFFDYVAAQPILWVLGAIAAVMCIGSLVFGGRR